MPVASMRSLSPFQLSALLKFAAILPLAQQEWTVVSYTRCHFQTEGIS